MILFPGSAFRFFRNGDVQRNVPARTLTNPKSLGEIVTIEGNLALKECKVITKASSYWSDSLHGKWTPLSEKSDDKLFAIRNDTSLQVSKSSYVYRLENTDPSRLKKEFNHKYFKISHVFLIL